MRFPRYVRSRASANTRPQTWKACWVQALASSNLASSAASSRENVRASRVTRLALLVSSLNFGPETPAQSGIDQGIHSLQLNHDGVLPHLLATPLPSRAFRPPPPTVGSYRSPIRGARRTVPVTIQACADYPVRRAGGWRVPGTVFPYRPGCLPGSGLSSRSAGASAPARPGTGVLR